MKVIGGGDGGITAWEELQNKPFTSIDSSTLNVENNVLKVINNIDESHIGIIINSSNIGTSNYIIEEYNKLYNTIENITLDNIENGLVNKFIINNSFSGDILVNGNLSAKNLNVSNITVLGTTTSIHTETQISSNIEIIANNTNGAALKIFQNDNINNIIECSNSSDIVFKIKNNGNVGISNNNPSEKLDINGNIKFSGNINNVSKTELNYLKNIDYNIKEKFNITHASNLETSNQILELSERIDNISLTDLNLSLNSNSSEYIETNNILINNNSTIVNTSIYNSDCFNIINYGVNSAFVINQIGENDIINILNNYTEIFKISNNGYIGNKNILNYNIDIDGTINSSYIKADGSLINNINLMDKSTTDLEEGSNLYFTEDRLYEFYENSNLLISNIQLTEILNNVQDIHHILGVHNLDSVSQGDNNKYIVNNIYDNDMVITGTLTVKNINVMELDVNYYKELYSSNLYVSPYENEYDSYRNISNIIRNVIIEEPTLGNNENLENRISSLIDYNMSNYLIEIDNKFYDRINNLTLDNISQGNINKYIVSNIYNDELVVNGKLITKLIDVKIENELESFYNNIYNNAVENPYAGDSEHLEDKINNIVNYNLSNQYLIIDNFVDNKIKTISLDNVIQGSINKFIVSNIYNDDLVINGKIITKLIDVKIEKELENHYNNIYNTAINNNNIADSEYINTKILNRVDLNMSNYINSINYNIRNVDANISNYIININDEVFNKFDTLSLDNIYQGKINKYIISNIYNDNLVVNGNVLSKLIDVRIENELSTFYNNLYNNSSYNNDIDSDGKSITLYDKYITLSKYVSQQTTNINNNINDIYNSDVDTSNLQANEINSLKNIITDLTNKISSIESHLGI